MQEESREESLVTSTILWSFNFTVIYSNNIEILYVCICK